MNRTFTITGPFSKSDMRKLGILTNSLDATRYLYSWKPIKPKRQKPYVEISPNWTPEIIKELEQLGKKHGFDVKPLW